MKLRIDGKSLRLRLSEAEVTQFKQIGKVEEVILFGNSTEQTLRYVLTQTPDSAELNIVFADNAVTVLVPTAIATNWVNTDLNGFNGFVANGTPKGLKILVEKDLDCLHRPD